MKPKVQTVIVDKANEGFFLSSGTSIDAHQCVVGLSPKYPIVFAGYHSAICDPRKPKEHRLSIEERAEIAEYMIRLWQKWKRDFCAREVDRLPTVVTLCGSTKFKKEYEEAYFRESSLGKIVLTVGCFTHADNLGTTEEQKAMLNMLHLRKIDMSDEILVINVDGYMGIDTKKEINYAAKHGKTIHYWE